MLIALYESADIRPRTVGVEGAADGIEVHGGVGAAGDHDRMTLLKTARKRGVWRMVGNTAAAESASGGGETH